MSTTLLLELPAGPNFPGGMPRQRFELRSAIWTGSSIKLPIEGRPRTIIGWDDGEPAEVHAVWATWLPPMPEEVAQGGDGPDRALEGVLVWGGEAGLRVLDEGVEPEAGAEGWPRGWGRPVVWVREVEELPERVQKIIGKSA